MPSITMPSEILIFSLYARNLYSQFATLICTVRYSSGAKAFLIMTVHHGSPSSVLQIRDI
jgi:hypothetical protein